MPQNFPLVSNFHFARTQFFLRYAISLQFGLDSSSNHFITPKSFWHVTHSTAQKKPPVFDLF